jgi:hypothetical protein
LVHKGVLWAIAIAAVGAAVRFDAFRSSGDPLPPVAKKWKWILGLVAAVFGALYLSNALAPELSPDGTAYHLVFPGYYARAHGFVRIWWNMYANISEGTEMLFLFAYVFGKHSAGAMVHLSFLAVTPALMICYARRFGFTAAGIAGGLFFFVSPIVGLDGSSAYVDVALAANLFALFYFLQIWAEGLVTQASGLQSRDSSRLLIPIGILAGFAFAIKYTALLALPYALGLIAWKLWRARQPLLRPLVLVAGVALIFILPWLLKNWLWMYNPVTPFANRLFPNPWVHISFEDSYSADLRNYGIKNLKLIPWLLTVDGSLLTGLFGPLFLLAPIALIALRFPAGRQLLLAASVFALTYPTNIGARFLIPCIPFLSIAMAMAILITRWEWLLAGVVLAHSVISWPNVMKYYCAPSAWRLDRVRWREALRIIPEDHFLASAFPGYNYDRTLERLVPPGGKVFSYFQAAEAYTRRQVFVKYLSAPNETLGDIVWTPIVPDFQPGIRLDFRFPEHTIRTLRLVKTKDMGTDTWDITEFRIYSRGNELPRLPQWRLTAAPNPWDVQLAFDNSPVTRWRTWEPARAGMFMQVDFGTPRPVDAVRIETQPTWRDPDLKLEGLDETGRWITLSDQPVRIRNPVTINLRRASMDELKARGIRYLLVGYDDIGAEDFQQYAPYWGIRFLADSGEARLYYIE